MRSIKLQMALSVCCMAFFVAGFAEATECSHPVLPAALNYLKPDLSVDVKTVTVTSWDGQNPAPEGDDFYYVFKPRLKAPKTGFIILPGGNCDPRCYAPAAHAIAGKGFWTCVLPMPSCVALPGYKRAGKVIQDNPEIKKWVIGGHSVGGTAACTYAVQTNTISGVAIWASLSGTDLSATSIKVLSVYGSLDGHASPSDVMENAGLLPPDTVFVEIQGGNHTQFGYIDPSPDAYLEDDNAATITLEDQTQQIVQATADFLKQFNENTCPVVSLFGGKDPRTKTIARFRDEILMKSAAGRGIIAFYNEHGERITEIFEKHPVIKSAAGKGLEIILPAIELLL